MRNVIAVGVCKVQRQRGDWGSGEGRSSATEQRLHEESASFTSTYARDRGLNSRPRGWARDSCAAVAKANRPNADFGVILLEMFISSMRIKRFFKYRPLMCEQKE